MAEPVVALAARHMIAPALWRALVTQGLTGALEPELADYLEAMHALNGRRNRRLLLQAGEIADVLCSAGIDAAFLKGTALLLLGWYPDSAARFIGDIDLLVPPERVQDAAAKLAGLGYRRLAEGQADRHDLVSLAHPERPAMVELHQSAVFLNIAAMLPTAELMARAVTVSSPAGAARVPCPDDLAVHNVLHCMLQHGHYAEAELPLRDALDLVQIAACGSPQWSEVARRLALGPWGPDILAFYAAATTEVFPGTAIPVPAPGPRAARRLRRWRARAGEPPGSVEKVATRLVDFAGDLHWRLRNDPGERSRMVARLLALRRYPHFLAVLAGIGGGWPVIPSRGRTRTDGP